MSANDIITIILAAYAAVLSTILAIVELRKNQRALTVFLEFVPFYEQALLRLVNPGTRPITVVSVAMEIFVENDGVNQPFWEAIPFRVLFERDPEKYPEGMRSLPDGLHLLPVHIGDGKQALLPLSGMISNMLVANHMHAKIHVTDASGKVYDKFTISEANPKFAAIPDVSKTV
jgi:hypothetical protein